MRNLAFKREIYEKKRDVIITQILGICSKGANKTRIVYQANEGFDLVLVNEALNSCVNIFNLYSGFLAYFTPKLAY